jgi:hypothetical protein
MRIRVIALEAEGSELKIGEEYEASEPRSDGSLWVQRAENGPWKLWPREWEPVDEDTFLTTLLRRQRTWSADVAYDGPDYVPGGVLEAVQELTRTLPDVSYRIPELGEGETWPSGWPEVTFFGPAEQLTQLRLDYRGQAGEDEDPPVWSNAGLVAQDTKEES